MLLEPNRMASVNPSLSVGSVGGAVGGSVGDSVEQLAKRKVPGVLISSSMHVLSTPVLCVLATGSPSDLHHTTLKSGKPPGLPPVRGAQTLMLVRTLAYLIIAPVYFSFGVQHVACRGCA